MTFTFKVMEWFEKWIRKWIRKITKIQHYRTLPFLCRQMAGYMHEELNDTYAKMCRKYVRSCYLKTFCEKNPGKSYRGVVATTPWGVAGLKLID